MKILLILTLLLINSLFANYNYANKTSGKIDMHGGKNDGLLKNKSPFSNMNQNSLIDKVKEKKEPTIKIQEEKDLQDLKDLEDLKDLDL
ncbi:MAG: hypothetical protein ACNI28_11620 [Arcobacter sp.]|uniref:hypothetical protein n=1 Tax=Arcobacter sp. TaxID=1872629 RepID=UPI003B001C2A